MIKGVDVDQRIEFVSKNDNEEVKTVFVFQPLSAEAMLNYVGDAKDGKLVLTGDKLFEFLAISIVEIKNYDTQKDTIKATLKTLPIGVISELVEEAGSINKMSEKDQKN